MNILFFHNTSDLYGAGRILLNVTENLNRNHHRPIVIVSEDGPLVAELEKRQIEVRIIRLGILRRKYFSVPGILNRIRVMKAAWKNLNQLIDDEKIDLIFSNTTGVLISAFLAKKRGLPHIWHVHEIITKPAMFTRAIGYVLKKYSDHVVVVSDAVKDHWKKHVGRRELTRIYNGIDLAPFDDQTAGLRSELNLPENATLIGMIGRVNKTKGQRYLLQIAKRTIDQYPDTRFILVGDAYPGNEYLVDELNEEIARSGLSKHVINLGYRSDIINIMNSLDIFILPSVRPDSFPTVILEAMAASKPVVATRQGGAVEMIEDTKSGILIPLDDAAAAAARIAPLIADPEQQKIMGQQGHERLKTLFSIETFDREFLKLINSFGSGSRPVPVPDDTRTALRSS